MKKLIPFIFIVSPLINAQNIALNKPVWVSSVQNPERAKHFVNDGNYDTYWSSEFEDNQSIIIDLGQDYLLEELKIYWEAAYTKHYVIGYSSDNLTYVSNYTVHNGNGGEDILNLSPRTGRYLKIDLIERGTSWGNAIYEIEVYGQMINETPNIALNKPVYVSSVESPGTNAKHFVNDGDYNTYWSSGYNDDEWVIIDLQDEYNLGELKIHWEGAYSKRYAIQISSDNSNYNTVYTEENGDGGIDIIKLNVITAKYLKINCFERATGYGNAIHEIEIYGQLVNNSTGFDFDQNANSFQWRNYGTQDWAVENAQVTTYRDGTSIYFYKDRSDWEGSYGAWCHYDNNESKGKLYNWNAVMGIHNISALNYPQNRKKFAPEGWRVPSVEDWEILKNYLISNGHNYDGSTSENKIAKAVASTTGWNNSNAEGAPGNNQSTNNSSGFNAIPIGSRNANGEIRNTEGSGTKFWTTNKVKYFTYRAARAEFLESFRSYFTHPSGNNLAYNAGEGFSVRFVRDVQTLTASTNNYSNPVAIFYPNPTTSIVTILGDKEYNIEVYDMAGNKVMALTGNTIDMSHLSSATYIVKALDKVENEEVSYKVVKN